MGEVLTETESIVKSKCGRFTAPLRCLLCDFNTQASHDAGLDYEQQEQVWSDHSDSMHPLVRVNPERSRLERCVIETATERYKAEEAAYCGGNTIKRTRALVKAVEAGKAEKEAVKALIDFESQIKK